MVGWLGVPSWPIAIGSPATLFETTTASAPAFCALRILVEKVQAPRAIKAIWPVRLPPGRAEQAVFKPLMPVPLTAARFAVRSLETVAKPPEAPATVSAPLVI